MFLASIVQMASTKLLYIREFLDAYMSRVIDLNEERFCLMKQVHDEVILEGPTESAEVAKAIVVDCMSKPFAGKNFLSVDLSVDAKCAQNWYSAK